MRADLHIHTHYSADSVASPEKIILRARQLGLDAIAVTDHSSGRAWPHMMKFSKKHDFPIICGEEVKIIEGGAIAGEITGLFLTEEIQPAPPMDVIDRIKKQGGLVVIPHPFDFTRHALPDPEKYVKHIHAVEVLNARTSEKNNQKALEFAERFKLAKTGGSDAHSVGEVGKAWTEAKAGDLEDFRKAIQKKKTQAQGGVSSPTVHLISTVAKTKVVGRP
jgi:hypothetical protein